MTQLRVNVSGGRCGQRVARTTALLVAFLVFGGLASCALAPKHAVLPYPDHVQAGLAQGDRVEVVTASGEVVEFTVTAVTDKMIVGDDREFALSEIRSISRRGWSAPKNPCDDGRPLQCSVPDAVKLASDFHSRFSEYFLSSCATHDYCYRYGANTYGYARKDCDAAFLDDMRAQCSGVLNLDLLWRAECLAAARHFHDAVVNHGGASYLGENGAECEYAGPRSAVLRQ